MKGHENKGCYCQKCSAWKGQLGLEPTPEMYIEHLTEMFNEVKRVLKKEGTLWLNMGDTYGGSCQGGGDTGLSKERYRKELLTYTDKPQEKLMPKCLLMIPERLAWSLIQNGWILRNKIIWYKPNAMPSSVKDRFSNRWEYMFLFSKSRKYYFDLDVVRDAHIWADIDRRSLDGKKHKSQGKCRNGQYAIDGVGYNPLGKNPGDVFQWSDHDLNEPDKPRISTLWKSAGVPRITHPKGRTPSDFWEIPTQPFPEAHFAVFPEKLCEKPIKAGCPEGGIVLDPFCGAGTALYVAKQLRRKFIGIDIKKEYCEMTEKRLSQGVL